MAEPTVTNGMPPPADLPRGELTCTSLAGGGLRIDQADPRVLISPEVLDVIAEASAPYAALDLAGCTPGRGYVGAVLKIEAVNRQVIYRIVDYLPRINACIGQWPD